MIWCLSIRLHLTDCDIECYWNEFKYILKLKLSNRIVRIEAVKITSGKNSQILNKGLTGSVESSIKKGGNSMKSVYMFASLNIHACPPIGREGHGAQEEL